MIARKFLLCLCLAIGASSAFAQNKPIYLGYLLDYPAVQRDLGLSTSLIAKQHRLNADPSFHRAKSLVEAQKILQQNQDRIVALLSPSQKKRLQEISYQYTGVMCFGDHAVSSTLGLTSDQQRAIGKAYEARHLAYQKVLRGAVGNGHLVGKDMTANQNRVIAAKLSMFHGFNADAVAVLDARQRALWTRMQGKPFPVDTILKPK